MGKDNGEILEGRENRRAPPGPICRQEGCYPEDHGRQHQGAPIRTLRRCRRCQVPTPHHPGHAQAYPQDEEACQEALHHQALREDGQLHSRHASRYSVESSMSKTLKATLSADTFSEPSVKKKFLKAAQGVFEAKYQENEGQKWLFEKLRF